MPRFLFVSNNHAYHFIASFQVHDILDIYPLRQELVEDLELFRHVAHLKLDILRRQTSLLLRHQGSLFKRNDRPRHRFWRWRRCARRCTRLCVVVVKGAASTLLKM